MTISVENFPSGVRAFLVFRVLAFLTLESLTA
jgi:hypothetical protein